MGVVSSLTGVVLPVFIVIGIGVLLARYLQPDLTSVNRVALYGAVPALVFSSLSKTELSLRGASRLVVAQLGVFAVMGALGWFASARFANPTRRGLAATSMFSNSANMMLPVTLFAFGEAGLERAVILYVLTTLALFTAGPLILAGGRGASLRKVLSLPVLWATLLGLSFNALHLSFPLGVKRGVDILSDAAIPTVLLVLGMQIYRSGWPKPSAVNLLGTALKLVGGPLVAFGVGRLVGASGLDLVVLTLLGAMPPAVNNFMLALEFGGNAEEVARTVVLSTLLTLFSLAVVLFALQGLVY